MKLPLICIGLMAVAFSVSADETRRPNILFAIADDASYPHFGAYGMTDWCETPNFDRVAKEGLLFKNAYTPNAKCAPSRACILTGRPSWQLEEAMNHLPVFPPKFQSWPEALAANGYVVARTGKGWAPGLQLDADGNQRQMAGPAFAPKKATPPAKMMSNNDYAANFEAFLDQRDVNEPFAFWYGASEPHRAYEYGAGVKKGGKSIDQIDHVPAFWPDNETVRTDLLDYAFEIEHFDDHLGRMLQILEDRGELGNTIVIVTSDNGMPFPRVKGQAYELNYHLPLAIMWPDGIANPGRAIDDHVNFIDFAPTILEAAKVGLESTSMQPMTGKSLFDLFAGEPKHEREFSLIAKERHDVGRPNDEGYPVRGISKDGWLYVRNYEVERWPAGNPITGYMNTDGSPTKTVLLEGNREGSEIARAFWEKSFGKRPEEEFYHVAVDPHCLVNLASELDHEDHKNAMRDLMEAELSKQEDPRMEGNGSIFDNYPVSSAAANFYERVIINGEKVKAGWIEETDFEESDAP